jgi:digeranylgeranylglycerophospholipid reductase
VGDVRDVDRDFVELYFGQSFAPGFFGWIIPRRDGSAKVGIASGLRANVRECFQRFIGKHPIASVKLRHAKQLTAPTYHPIPVGGGARRTYADGIMTVGDAASQVKPTTGGGIVFGLACGRLAGETATRAMRCGDTSARILKEYDESWRDLIGFDLNAMSWLRRLLYRLPDRQLDRIFSVSRELRADEILNRTVDIDFQGRTLLSLARDPRFFMTLLSASVLSVPSLARAETR